MERIIIMGATSGIGLAVARKLAAAGCRLGLAARHTESLAGIAAEYPGNIVCEDIDITRADAGSRLRSLIDRLGGMDCYLHVAGVGYGNPLLDPGKEIATVETDVVGFTRMVGSAYRYFRDECGGKGHIGAVTSVAGTNGIDRLAAYSASKCFDQCYLRALSQLVRGEKLKIRITDIRPGWVRTPLLSRAGGYPMLMKPDYVAGRIIRAVRHGRRVAVIDWRWNIVVGLWRLLPNWLWVRIPVSVEI